MRKRTFLDSRRQFRDGKVLLGCNFDDIDVMEHILPDRLPCAICPVNEQKLLLQDGLSESGIEADFAWDGGILGYTRTNTPGIP